MDLTRKELDLVILGSLSACSDTTKYTASSKGHHKVKERKRGYTQFMHSGKRVCKTTFCYLHGIGKKRLAHLVKHYIQNGITPREQGNSRKTPSNTLSFKSVEYILCFLHSLVDQQGILLPGRVSGYKRDDLKLLPSSLSKKEIWRKYCESMATMQGEVKQVYYITFCHLWKELTPQIVVMKPMTDLCWTCQKNNAAVIKASNRCEDQKSSALQVATRHIELAEQERTRYNIICKLCKESVLSAFLMAHPHLSVTTSLVLWMQQSTTLLTWPSKYITLLIHYNLALYTSSPPGSAMCLVYAVRESPDRCSI